jgi:hypothetical protein
MTTRREFGALAAALALGAGAAGAQTAPDETGDALRGLYLRFVAAQNARDLARMRETLWDSPDFLWISDGRPFWGPDAMLERMSQFQKAEVWRVDPELAAARPVALAGGAAYLLLPLTLTIGPAAAPSRLRFLVGMLARREETGWRIAALFTTEDKRG